MNDGTAIFASATRRASTSRVDWSKVRRVLVVRLRSIGDTVLATPSLIALKRFLPDAEVDILLEDWVAPLLDGSDFVDHVLSTGEGITDRLRTALAIRRRRYDVAFNLHGGTTGTFFTFASGARHRVGYREYQYSFLYNHLLSSSADFWRRTPTHSAEQQLALPGFVGVPVEDGPKTRLDAAPGVADRLAEKFRVKTQCSLSEFGKFALVHPAAAFGTKTWAADNFARVAEFLAEKGFRTIAVAAANERAVLEALRGETRVPIATFDDLTLPEVTAFAAKANLFVGNDSGIAHIAAAVGTPTVVVFGSSNADHWRPWTDAPNEIVRLQLPCQPCAGYECREFGEPRCIQGIAAGAVIAAVERMIGSESEKGRPRDLPLILG